jgi:hypothetical protein
MRRKNNNSGLISLLVLMFLALGCNQQKQETEPAPGDLDRAIIPLPEPQFGRIII